MFKEVVQLVGAELSGINAKQYAADIARFHRIQASPGFHEAVEYVREALEELGYSVTVHKYPADGRTLYLDGYRAPIGWRLISGELKVVKPRKMLLGRVIDNPTVVVAHSGANPGVEAELVDVGRGDSDEDYKDVDVSGKFVLASGSPRRVHRKAIEERGATGIILYSERTRAPSAYPYRSLWPRAEETDKMGMAFSISLEKALMLKRLLANGRVTVYGRVKSEFYEGFLEVVEASLDGESDEEILLTAHLCHPKPGANDNASGSGLLIEIARTLKTLRKKPKRKIGFLWIPEFSGTIAHLDRHPELTGFLKAVINLDMVGGNQEKTGGTITITGVPELNPSFMPFLAYKALELSIKGSPSFGREEKIPRLRYALIGYAGGSDHHVFADPVIDVPAVAYVEWPDEYYHTDQDSADNLDPEVLGSIGVAAASLTLYLANMGDKEALEAAYISAAMAKSLISREAVKLTGKSREYAELRLKYLGNWYSLAVKRLTSFADSPTCDAIAVLASSVKNHASLELSLLSSAVKSLLTEEKKLEFIEDSRIYERTKRCPLSFREILDKLPEERRKIYEKREEGAARILASAYFFFDGKKTLTEIHQELCAAYGYIKPELLKEAVKDLETAGWLRKTG